MRAYYFFILEAFLISVGHLVSIVLFTMNTDKIVLF